MLESNQRILSSTFVATEGFLRLDLVCDGLVLLHRFKFSFLFNDVNSKLCLKLRTRDVHLRWWLNNFQFTKGGFEF